MSANKSSAAAGAEGRVTNNSKKRGSKAFSALSLVFAAAPVLALLLVFTVCFALSGGDLSDNGDGAVWWLFLAALVIFIPVAAAAGIASLAFGVIGLKSGKSAFAFSGIAIVALEAAAAAVLILLFR